MRLIFMGTSPFALPCLEALASSHYLIPLVITQPDRHRGRGRERQPTPVKLKALELGLTVFTPERIKDAEPILKAASPDLFIVVSYGQILPLSLLQIPTIGCLNVHPSLLPRYRGAAPIQRALINGERETGVTIMWMNEGLDKGDIFLQEPIDIGPNDTYGELHNRLASMGANLLLDALNALRRGEKRAIPQDEDKATYAPPIEKGETNIPWEEGCWKVHNLIRGLSPSPGAFTPWRTSSIKILKSRVVEGAEGRPGEVVEADPRKGRLVIACGEGGIEALQVQPAGRRKMDGASFVRGYLPQPGELWGKR